MRNTVCISTFSLRISGGNGPLPSRGQFIQSFPYLFNGKFRIIHGMISVARGRKALADPVKPRFQCAVCGAPVDPDPRVAVHGDSICLGSPNQRLCNWLHAHPLVILEVKCLSIAAQLRFYTDFTVL